jgi:long-chain acyl-CoA synthetase
MSRVEPPTAAEIERRFASPLVVGARPLILAGIATLGFACRFQWTAEGTSALLDGDGPTILAANHASHADTAAILGTLPRPIRRRTCVAAALDVFGPNGETRTIRAFRRECLQVIVAAGFHAFAFDRSGPPLRSLRTAVDLVRGGWNLLLYPEGTRSRTGELGEFKAGVGVLARVTQRPVVPVNVAGGTSILPCGATVPRSGHAHVRFGEPIRISRGESGHAFADRVRQRVRELGSTATRTAAKDTVESRAPLATIPPGDVRQRSA